MAAATTAEPKSKSKPDVSAEPTIPASSRFDLEAAYGAPAGLPLFLGIGLQRKLAVGAVDDPLEREADQVAEQVMRMPEPAVQASPTTWDTPSRCEDGYPTLSELHSTVQRKCACGGSCEECKKREEELPATPTIQRRASGNGNSDTGGSEAPPIVHEVLRSPGQSLDGATRNFFEPRFGQDFGQVRVHTDGKATESAQAVQARAYTVGQQIVLGTEHQPGTARGQALLAHELAHTLQQGDNGGPMAAAHRTVRRGIPDPIETEAKRLADDSGRAVALSQAGGPPLIQRDPQPTAGQNNPVADQQKEMLRRAALELCDEDQKQLLANFPTGIILFPQDLFILATWSNSVASVHVGAFRVTDAIPLEAGMEAYIFRVGKGRAILLSSRGGPSVMLDAGVGVSDPNVPGFNELLGADMVSPPAILLSHTDADHTNRLDSVLQAPGMDHATVEIGRQQLRNTVGQGDWARANVHFTPTQALIEIDVLTANGVHLERRVLGNMEITEFRLVAPAQVMGTPGLTTGQYRGQKNASSPVTIVQDLTTGETWVFFADAPGRTVSDVVDLVGEAAFRTLLGGGGRNLRLAEAPHHGGKEGRGRDSLGRIRALRLMFEASDGGVRFFTQTSQSFGSGASASINFLDQVGMETERILDQAASTPGISVVRAESDRLEEITIDNQAIQQVVQMAAPTESDIMAGYRQRNGIQLLRQRATALYEALSRVPERSEIAESVQQLIADLDGNSANLDQALDAYWLALETATAQGPGIRLLASTLAINNAGQAIRNNVTQTPLQPLEDSVGTHEKLLTAEIALIQNAIEMRNALKENRIEDVEKLKEVQSNIMRQAAAALGAKEVEARVRAAWAATEAVWTPRVMSNIGARLGTTERAEQRMEVEFHETLGESLSEQMRTQEIAETSGMGTFTEVPLRGKAGATFMLAVEAFTIGFELYEQHKAAKQSEEIEEQNRKIRGRNMVQWWLARGVVPIIALVDDDGKQVAPGLEQKALYEILSEKYAGTVPEFDQVVVCWVSEEDRLSAVAQLSVAASNLDDWYRLVEDQRYGREPHGHTPFLRDDDKWYTLLYNLPGEEYRIDFNQKVSDRLEALYALLRSNQAAGLAINQAQNPADSIYTVKDTGWIRTLRYVKVYRDNGHLDTIDFGHTKPRFWKGLLGSGVPGPWKAPPGMEVVRAADLPTYERLREYWWPVHSIDWESEESSGISLELGANAEGYGLVNSSDLREVDASL